MSKKNKLRLLRNSVVNFKLNYELAKRKREYAKIVGKELIKKRSFTCLGGECIPDEYSETLILCCNNVMASIQTNFNKKIA